ncbi:uncharacterized protein N7503_006213 [Penicillium pulvis]|uniref:uncharacterized protein n=1 Tax=Penicillium pulvis TaxID=1562058 RepID=UPI0025483250|nr:uncharacterized protein N7503_006213 [Penicillium pulvis]KAJ5798708.1 hypothetical protein N7503_006213 [Penicillium pulvis]
MASIYQLNHPHSWDPSATGLEDHPFFARGGHHHGPHAHHGPPGPPGPPPHFWGYGGPHHGHHGHHGPPQFWGWGGPGEHGPRGRRHHHRGEWEHPENNEEVEAPAEENAEASGSTEKIPETHDKEVDAGEKAARPVTDTGLATRVVLDSELSVVVDITIITVLMEVPAHLAHTEDLTGLEVLVTLEDMVLTAPPHHHAHPMFGFGGPMGGKGHKGHKGPKGPKGGRRGRGMRGGGPDKHFMRQLSAFFGFPLGQNDVDFQPSVDVFDTPVNYILHVSLPGAKKGDLNIDYDAEESVIRLTGVIHRPGMDENLHQALVMEERAREVGVFEREIRLGTRHAPARVIVDGIVAKLEDGVLTVTIPKIEELESKKVLIEDGDVLEKDAMVMDEHVSRTITPGESEESESEEEAREYVKIAVQ